MNFENGSARSCPSDVVPWLAERLEVGGGTGGLPASEAKEKAQLCTFGFEPGDIVSQVMSFGSSKPIAVRVIGTDYEEVRKHAGKNRRKTQGIALPP